VGFIRRWLNRRDTNELCVQAIRVRRAMDIRRLAVGIPGNDLEDTTLSLHSMAGKLNGLRAAICIVNGWDADIDARNGGPADKLIQEHWAKEYPETWKARA
jgi:hypothetical protein